MGGQRSEGSWDETPPEENWYNLEKNHNLQISTNTFFKGNLDQAIVLKVS